MSTTQYFSRILRFVKNFICQGKKEKSNDSINKLIHPRFEISQNDALAQKMVPNSLLFLMYSQENETLFI